MGSYDDDLRFAHVLADAADDITTKRFRALDLRVETKPDLTPVSDADRATEDSLRNILRRSRPRDAVLGEESGQTGSGPRRWVIDPIDATKNYVRGVPVWATLIGLMDGDEVVVGRGHRARPGAPLVGRQGRRRVDRQVADQRQPVPGIAGQQAVGRLVLLLGDRRLGGDGRLDGFLSLSQAVWRTRGFGDFWSHMLVAEGAVDVSAEPDVSLWDLAALQVIVEEAGGRFTSLDGSRDTGRRQRRLHQRASARRGSGPSLSALRSPHGLPGGEFPLRPPGLRPAGFPGRPGAAAPGPAHTPP